MNFQQMIVYFGATVLGYCTHTPTECEWKNEWMTMHFPWDVIDNEEKRLVSALALAELLLNFSVSNVFFLLVTNFSGIVFSCPNLNDSFLVSGALSLLFWCFYYIGASSILYSFKKVRPRLEITATDLSAFFSNTLRTNVVGLKQKNLN